MSVEKLFWKDPYLTELYATIMSVHGSTITLDKTIFYAFSGGQESDSGTIGGFDVIEAKKHLNEIIYSLGKHHTLKEGDPVLVKIDWEKRYRIMKLHFAAEIFLELLYQQYDHPKKIGANITSEKARLDFEWNGNISLIFPDLLKKATDIINSNYQIRSEFSDATNERRYWEIQGFSKVECGGTHIKRTAEIGNILLKRKNIGNGKERIEIYLEPGVVSRVGYKH